MNRKGFLKRLGAIAVGVVLAPSISFLKESNGFVAYKFSSRLVSVSEELLNDSLYSLHDYLGRAMAERLMKELDEI